MNWIIKHKTVLSLLTLPLFIFIIIRIVGFDGLYGQDSYEYLRYSNRIYEWILTGVHPGDFFWPQGYPIVTGICSLILPINFTAQLISALSFGGILIYTHKLIKSLNSNHKFSFIYLIISLLLAPYMLRGAMTSMSDMLAIFCLTGSTYYALIYKKKHTFSALISCVFLSLFSIFTRYAVAIPVFILFLSCTYYWAKIVKLHHTLVLLLPFAFISAHLYFETEGLDFIKHDWLRTWSLQNFIKRDYTEIGSSEHYSFPNLLYGFFTLFHPGFLLINGLLTLLIIRKHKDLLAGYNLVLIACVLGYGLFLVGIPFQNNRFLLVTYPIVTVLLFPAFEFYFIKFIAYKKVIILCLIFIQITLFTRAFYPIYSLNKFEKTIYNTLTKYEGETLYSFNLDVALQGRGLEFNYQNMWVKEYNTFKTGALVLFNHEQFETQWKDKNPMLNWEHLNNKHSLKTLQKLDNGWKLYRIE